MVFLSHCQKDIDLDSQTLLETAFTFKITKSLLNDLELFYRFKHTPKWHPLLSPFNLYELKNEDLYLDGERKKKYYWIVHAATPEDLQKTINKCQAINEEEILEFYQYQIKNRKLREIVEELQTEEESEIANVNSYAIEKKDIQNAKMLQPSQRKKETLHSKYAQSAANQQKRKTVHMLSHFKTDSNNTIVEMTNDFSRGSKGAVKNLSYLTSSEKRQSSSEHQLHLSVVMNSGGEALVTPRGVKKIHMDYTSKNKKEESPFVNIGTKIKSIFGNFFKTQEKLNRSFEDPTITKNIKNIEQSSGNTETNMNNITANEQKSNMIAFTKMNSHNKFLNDLAAKKHFRSKSIHNSVVMAANETNYGHNTSDLRIHTSQYQSNQHQKEQYQTQNTSLYQSKPGAPLSSLLPPTQKHKTLHQEDSHHLPNTNSLVFSSQSTHLQQVQKPGSHVQNVISKVEKLSINESKNVLRLQKQMSKSVERTSEGVIGCSMIGEEEDCEIDLLSNSDYAIGTVTENIKRNKLYHNERPEIYISKDLMVVGDEELQEAQSFTNLEIQSFTHKNLGSSSMNSTLKMPLSNKKQMQANNIKTMKSSPPVSPKEKQTLSAQKAIKTPHFIINKRK